MDANRYFEQMHQVMSAQKRDFSLILSIKVQDLGGADAYIELRRNASGRARVFYSTMGRRAGAAGEPGDRSGRAHEPDALRAD